MLKNYRDKDISYYHHTRKELVPYIPENLKVVLDIGCSSGGFGLMVKKIYGCTVWGIEPDTPSALKAEKVLDKVLNSIFNSETKIPVGQKFDCIFFNDVLEHLADPDEALLLAGKLLTKGGHIVASIPNIRFYPVMLSLIRYKDFKYLNAGVMDKTHLRFFTQKSMVRLFEENGYEVKKIEGIDKNNFRYLNILNVLLFNRLDDMKYPQFAIVARLK